MSNQDDALPLPRPRPSKGPTAENLKALAVQDAWLKKNINWKALRSLAYGTTRDAVIGGEIVQELYHDMLQWAPEELQGLRTPQAYAKTAVGHRLSNWRRQFDKTTPLPDDYDRTPDEAPSLDEVLETREQILNLVAELPKEWYEPLILCKVYGYKNKETAQRLNLTVDAVKKRVLRAVNYLRVLAAAPPPPPSMLNRVRKFIQRKERHHDK